MKNFFVIFLTLGIFLVVLPSSTFAANRYWVGSSGGATNDDANWASADPASCTGGGASAPSTGDVAIFDADCDNNASVTGTFSVQGVSIVSGYTGTISQNAVAMTIGSGGWVQAGGTFTGNSDGSTANITLNSGGDFDLSGGTFTSTNDTLRNNDNWTISGGTFTHNSGTVAFNGDVDGAATITGSATLNNLTFLNYQGGANCNSVLTIAAATTLTVNGTLTIGVGTDCMNQRINGTGSISAKGDVTVSGDGFLGSVVITIDGTGTQTLTGSGSDRRFIPSVTIDKASGTLNFSGTITFTDNLTYTTGTLSFGTSTLQFYAEQDNAGTITGSFSPYNVTFMNYNGGNCNYVYTIATGTTITVTNTLTLGTGGDCNSQAINGPGSLTVEGNLVTANDAFLGDIAITMSGANAQTITHSGTYFPTGTFTINKPSGTVTLATAFPLSGSGQDLLISRGTLNLSTFTLTVNDTITNNGTIMTAASGDLVVGSGGLNNQGGGQINFGSQATCGAADGITITSTTPGTARTWTGNGTYDFYDVAIIDVNDVKGSVVGWSSTNNGNNTNVKVLSTCPTPPISYWKFDEGQGTTAQDSSPSNNDGTLNTSPLWATEDMCKSGKCLRFNQTSDQSVTAPTSASLQPTNITLSVWVKFNAANYNARIIDQGSEDYLLNLESDDVATGTKKIRFVTNFGHAIESNSGVPLNEWIHVAATYDGSISKMYINGTLQNDTSSWSGSISQTADTVYLGNSPNGSNPLNGFMDDFKIYNYAFTYAQIKKDFNGGAGTVLGINTQNNDGALSDGLVGYWKMDQASWNGTSDEAIDSSGNGNHGTAAGNATTASGKFGNGGTFDGSGDYVSIPDAANLRPNDGSYSVSIWANPSNANQTSPLITKRQNGSPFEMWGIYICGSEECNSNGQQMVVLYQDHGTGNYKRLVTTDDVVDGNWHMYSFVADKASNLLKLYVDGQIKATTGGINGTWPTVDNTDPIRLGNDNGTTYYTNKLDEARVYNRALTTAEVSSLYSWSAGPVGYWKMDEKAGTTANDSSGNGNTGTLTNSPTWHNGKYGGAVDYLSSANNQYISVPNSSSINDVPALTISGWIKYRDQGVSSIGTILSKENSGGTTGYAFRMHGSGSHNLRFTVQHGTTDLQRNTNFGLASGVPLCGSTVSGAESGWCHVAVTWDGTTSATGIRFYLNGVEAPYSGPIDGVGARQSDASETLRIGQNGNVNRSFNGKTDEMKVYNYVRTQAQIIEDMNGGHSAPGSPVGSSVSYWKLDEGYGTTANDSTPNDNDLTLNTATSAWTSNAKFSNGWVGLGTNWMSRADDSDLDFAAADDGTISLWFKSTSATNPGATEYLLSKGPGSTAAGYAIYANTSGQICFGIDDDTTFGPDDSSCSTSDIYDGTFHHISAVKTGTTSIQLFVDGKAQTADSSISATGTLANSSILYVGDFNGSDNGNEFNGILDEIKVYRSALNVSQIGLDLNQSSAQTVGSLSSSQTQPNAGSSLYCIPGDSATCTAPIGNWTLDTWTGAGPHNTPDLSGNENTLGVINDGSANGHNKNCIKGKCYQFDGVNKQLRKTSANAVSGKTTITINAWAYLDSYGDFSQGTIFSLDGSSTRRFNLKVNGGSGVNRLQFLADFSTTDGVWSTANSTLTTGRWYNFTVTYDGSSTSNTPLFYINGINYPTTTQTAPVGTLNNTVDTIYIGGDSTGTAEFGGRVDDTLLFDYIRTPAQVAWDYNRGAPILHYAFDECQGTTINNSITNSLHGILTSAATPGTCTTSGSWFNGVAGKNNYSLDFDGTDDYVQIPYNAALNPKVVTVAAWIKPGSYSNWNKVISTDYNGTGTWSAPFVSYAMGFYASGGSALFEITTGGSKADAISSTVLNTGQWYHLVGTYDGTNMKLYVNGKLETTTSKTGDIDYNGDTNDLTIARASHYVNENPFDGQVDDVRIYNYPLTDVQVKNLYSNNAAYKTGPVTGAP